MALGRAVPGGHTKTKNRMLHGYEGRGRFKVFALGRVADWRVTYRTDTDDLRSYDITMFEDNIREVRITDAEDVAAGESGVEIEVSELHREFRSLEPDNAVQELAEIFALYLKDYRDVSIFYEGQRVDPGAVIAATQIVSLAKITAYPRVIEEMALKEKDSPVFPALHPGERLTAAVTVSAAGPGGVAGEQKTATLPSACARSQRRR